VFVSANHRFLPRRRSVGRTAEAPGRGSASRAVRHGIVEDEASSPVVDLARETPLEAVGFCNIARSAIANGLTGRKGCLGASETGGGGWYQARLRWQKKISSGVPRRGEVCQSQPKCDRTQIEYDSNWLCSIRPIWAMCNFLMAGDAHGVGELEMSSRVRLGGSEFFLPRPWCGGGWKRDGI
jgi:hypothetical protein